MGVVIHELLAPLFGHLCDADRLRRRAVVLPELDPGLGVGGELLLQAQGSAPGIGRHHGARSEIQPDAHHVGAARAALSQRGRHHLCEAVEIVLRVLKKPVRPQRRGFAARQLGIQDAVGEGEPLPGSFLTRFHVHQERPNGLRPEIKPQAQLSHPRLLSSCQP